MENTKFMTEGKPWLLILKFSIPILIGQIVQLFYSLVDTKIVGPVLGELALASVGSVSEISNMTTGSANGLTLGFSIMMSMCFGRKDERGVRNAFATDIWLSLALISAAIAGLMIFLHPILSVLHVPEDELAMPTAHIRILIIGLFATVLYNMFGNALRAIGDSVAPLIFLIVAMLSNVALDLLFILALGMGVNGAAWATVLAQAVSVVFCYIRVWRKFPILHLTASDFRPDRHMLGEMVKSGLFMGLMFCLTDFGSVLCTGGRDGSVQRIELRNKTDGPYQGRDQGVNPDGRNLVCHIDRDHMDRRTTVGWLYGQFHQSGCAFLGLKISESLSPV